MPRAGTPGSAGRREYGHSPPEDHHSPLRQASAPLLPTNLGFDERSIKVEGPTATVLDGMGSEKERLVSVDELKNRFFILGLQTGFALQMFVMAVVMMATTYRMVGATEELSRYATQGANPGSRPGPSLLTRLSLVLDSVYYTLFRGLFLACFFFSCYGVDLYVWKRYVT